MSNSNPFFISDTHYYHSNIIRYCNRPFWKSGFNEEGIPISIPDVELMNETIKTNWNKKVKPQDTVYFLGDFIFADQSKVKELLNSLNGNIHLIRGNHDTPLNNFHSYFTSVSDLKTIHVDDEDAPRGKQTIALCHYPMLRWDRQYHGSIHLHGHSHGKIPFDPKVRRIDVGVDVWNFSPVSYEEIKQYFANRV